MKFRALLLFVLSHSVVNGQDTVEELTALASSKEANNRAAAAAGLRDFVYRFGHAKIRPLYQKLMVDGDVAVRREAIGAVTHTPFVAPHSTKDDVKDFIRTLTPIVKKLTRDEDPDIRRLARVALSLFARHSGVKS